MATPRIADASYYRLNIPKLSGGINTRDGFSHIQDDQLTECRNVWYKNGVLRTRPGVMCGENVNFENDIIKSSQVADYKLYSNPKNYRVIGGTTYFLTVFQYSNKLVFRYYSNPDNYIPVAEIYDIPGEDFTCNIFQHKTDIYCFCSGYYKNEATPYYVFKITEKNDDSFEYKRITDDDFYVPTVAVNCGTNGYRTGYDGGTLFEGYNLLGNRYKLYYSTVNKSQLKVQHTGENPSHPMIYYVPFDKNALSMLPSLFKVTITDANGEKTTHTVDKYDGELSNSTINFWESKTKSDNLYVSLYFFEKTNELQISFWNPSTGGNAPQTKDIFEYEHLENNMEIILPCVASQENYEKVLNMTYNEWFGGSSKGIYGGVHLFLGGNTKKSEEALVIWSDLEKPLYFSENSYVYVGDKSQRVTAMGRQGEALIILKERETYATQYVESSSNIDAEALKNQSVVDITSAEVYFPMMQVHGFIGCDCPSTVQMCRNRLVWLHSDGKVYTLTSANQYNERSIFEVSGMIERKLQAETMASLKTTLSADWEGNYVLISGSHIYLMDYNSYGYANVSSYSKNDDAQLRIPWWVWEKPRYSHNTFIYDEIVENRMVESLEKPIDIKSVISIGNRLYIWALLEASCKDSGYSYLPELMYFDGDNDIVPDFIVSRNSNSQYYERNKSIKKISSMFQTKFFDFGAPSIKKKIPKVELTFGANGGTPINASIITDVDADENTIIIDNPETEIESPANFKSYLIRPKNSINHRIGFRLESEGDMSVDAMSLQYKTIGGLK